MIRLPKYARCPPYRSEAYSFLWKYHIICEILWDRSLAGQQLVKVVRIWGPRLKACPWWQEGVSVSRTAPPSGLGLLKSLHSATVSCDWRAPIWVFGGYCRYIKWIWDAYPIGSETCTTGFLRLPEFNSRPCMGRYRLIIRFFKWPCWLGGYIQVGSHRTSRLKQLPWCLVDQKFKYTPGALVGRRRLDSSSCPGSIPGMGRYWLCRWYIEWPCLAGRIRHARDLTDIGPYSSDCPRWSPVSCTYCPGQCFIKWPSWFRGHLRSASDHTNRLNDHHGGSKVLFVWACV